MGGPTARDACCRQERRSESWRTEARRRRQRREHQRWAPIVPGLGQVVDDLVRLRGEVASFGYYRGFGATDGMLVNADSFAQLSYSRQDGDRDWSERENTRFVGNVYRLDVGQLEFGAFYSKDLDHPIFHLELLCRQASSWYAGPTLEWSPDDDPVDMANTFFADSSTLWGFKAGRQIAKGISLFLEARNLDDHKDAATTGVIADARGRDSAQFLLGDVRSFFAGIDWRL